MNMLYHKSNSPQYHYPFSASIILAQVQLQKIFREMCESLCIMRVRVRAFALYLLCVEKNSHMTGTNQWCIRISQNPQHLQKIFREMCEFLRIIRVRFRVFALHLFGVGMYSHVSETNQ